MTADWLSIPSDFVEGLFRLDDQVAVVTGGGGGLGEAIVHGLAQAGAKVLVADRDADAAKSVASKFDSNVAGLEVDVTSSEAIEGLVTATMEKFGKVDVLVNGAGISGRAPAEDFPEALWDQIIDVNLKGTFLACQAFGKRMLQSKQGSIVNIASIAGQAGYPNTTAYAQSKGGIVQMTRTLAIEWINRGVRVNAIAPSMFDTPLLKAKAVVAHSNVEWVMSRTPIGRYGRPSEIIGPVLFLASEASSMVTGHILAVDGGYLAA